MLFSNLQLECCYDVNNISKFYEDLQKIYPNSQMTIIWRKGLKKTDDSTIADSVVIKKDSKTLFSAVYQKSRGILKLSGLQDKEAEVLRAIKNNDLTYSEPPSFTTGILCAILYFFIFIFLIATRLDSGFVIFLFIAFALMCIGLASYAMTLSGSRNTVLLRVTSIIAVVGLLPLAPGSMLLMPLMLALSRNTAHKIISQS